MRRGFTMRIAPARVHGDAEVERIHRAALEVLIETGCTFESERALKLLKENGCAVDFDTRVARMPPDLVEWSIGRCPSSFLLRSRNPKNNLLIDGNTLYFMSSLGEARKYYKKKGLL